MIGNISVQQLYEYAVQNNCLALNVSTVLDVMEREISSNCNFHNKTDNNNVGHKNYCPISGNNVHTVDFSTLVEYSTEDLLLLLSM